MGGIGKTTIAKWLFDKHSSQYEGSCFLPNIRENSEKHGQALCDLLNVHVSKLLDGKERTTNVESPLVKRRRLCCKRVFVVLDDVSTSKQLEYLLRELQYLGSGSRIIITTRDKHVLIKGRVDAIHEVKVLNFQESLQLFSLKAFHQNLPIMGYEEVTNIAVDYAKGVPLALEVLGSFLYSKTENEWKSALQKLKRNAMEEIQSVLRLSYDGLDYEEREIFLDIACLLKGDEKEHVISLLDSCGFAATIGLRNLQDKALITIGRNVRMHDLIQEMGREIVRQESIKKPERRSRLWHPNEVHDVLKYNRGTNEIEGIMLDMSQIKYLQLNDDTFKQMSKLRFLKIYSSSGVGYSSLHLTAGLQLRFDELRHFEWHGYPLKSLPSNFCSERLVELLMPNSHVEKLWDGEQDLVNLKKINLRGSRRLMNLPDFSKASNLGIVDLSDCESLCQVNPSLLSLHSLVVLLLNGCTALESLKSEIYLRSLERIDVVGCSSLRKFSMPSEAMTHLDIWNTGIGDLMVLTERFSKFDILRLDGLRIENLPNGSSCLRNLEQLSISTERKLRIDKQKLHVIFEDVQQSSIYLSSEEGSYLSELPDIFSSLSMLESLSITDSNIERLPASIKQLTRLRSICLSCKSLRSVPQLPQSTRDLNLRGSNIECLTETLKQLTLLETLDLSRCKNLRSLPELPQSITDLVLSGSNIEGLTETLKQLTLLRALDLYDCKNLRSLPELPQSITLFDAGNCTSLETVILPRISIPSRQKGSVEFHLQGCVKLDKDAVSYILEDTYSTIKQSAYEIEEILVDVDDYIRIFTRPMIFKLALPGSRVPKWFKDNRTTEASITIELDRPSHIVAFAFCIVLPPFISEAGHGTYIECNQVDHDGLTVGKSAGWSSWSGHIAKGSNFDHVYLWCVLADYFSYSTTTCNSKVSFQFVVETLRQKYSLVDQQPPSPRSPSPRFIRTKECGVYPIYGSKDFLTLVAEAKPRWEERLKEIEDTW